MRASFLHPALCFLLATACTAPAGPGSIAPADQDSEGTFAEILEGAANMAIGKRNHAMLRKVLWKTDTKLDAEDIGGNTARTMSLDLTTGEVQVRARGEDLVLWRPKGAPRLV